MIERKISDFLTDKKVKINQRYFENEILSHPDYPSLLSVTDTLTLFGIDYNLFRIGANPEQLNFSFLLKLINTTDLSFPFILPVGGELIILSNVKDLQMVKTSLKNWNGLILIIDTNSRIIDHTNNELKQKELINKIYTLTILLGLSLISMIFLMESYSIKNIIMSLSGLIGSSIGFVLFTKDVGFKIKPIERFCKTSQNIDNCDSILASKGSSLIGQHVTMSSIVICYFIFQLVVLPLSTVESWRQTIFSLLYLTSISSLPFVIYSIYYQFRKKYWCKLCLMIAFLLCIQFCILIDLDKLVFWSLNIRLLLSSALIFIILLASVILIKNELKKRSGLTQRLNETNRVIYSLEVFEKLHYKNEKIEYQNFEEDIILGDRNAPVDILMVISVNCSPCVDAYKAISQGLIVFKGKVKVRVRLIMKDKSDQITQHLIHYWALNIRGNKQEEIKSQKLLDDWFFNQDINKFKKKYPLIAHDKSSQIVRKNPHNWLMEKRIRKTPTTFVNGFELDEIYSTRDFLHIIPNLASQITST